MKLPLPSLVLPSIPMPQDEMQTYTLEEYAANEDQIRGRAPSKWYIPSTDELKSLSGGACWSAVGTRLICLEWEKYRSGLRTELQDLLVTGRLILDKHAGTPSVKGIERTTTISIVNGLLAEISLQELVAFFYNKEITSLALVSDEGRTFFKHAHAKACRCESLMRISCLHLAQHNLIVEKLADMISLCGSMMSSYSRSLLPQLSADAEIIRHISEALYFRAELQKKHYFVSVFAASLLRVPPRPVWTERACQLVYMSNAMSFNAKPATHMTGDRSS